MSSGDNIKVKKKIKDKKNKKKKYERTTFLWLFSEENYV